MEEEMSGIDGAIGAKEHKRPEKRRRLSNHGDLEACIATKPSTLNPLSAIFNPSTSSTIVAKSTTPVTFFIRNSISSSDEQREKEIRAGITSFIDPENQGFSGILKQRYTDFIVNEVLPNGQVVHLTDSKRSGCNLNHRVQASLSEPDTPQKAAKRAWHNLAEHLARDDAGPRLHVGESKASPVVQLLATVGAEHSSYQETFRHTTADERLGDRRVISVTKSQRDVASGVKLSRNCPAEVVKELDTVQASSDCKAQSVSVRSKADVIGEDHGIAQDSIAQSEYARHKGLHFTTQSQTELPPIEAGRVSRCREIEQSAILGFAATQSLHLEPVPVLNGTALPGISSIDVTCKLPKDADGNVAALYAEQPALTAGDSLIFTTSEEVITQPSETARQLVDQLRTKDATPNPSDELVNASSFETPLVGKEDVMILNSLFGADTTMSIIELYRKVLQSPAQQPNRCQAVLSEKIEDRLVRTRAHQAVRQIFAAKLETVTSGRNGESHVIRIVPTNLSVRTRDVRTSQISRHTKQPAMQGRNGQRGRSTPDEIRELRGRREKADYLHFTLYKENKDTMEVIQYLAHRLHIPAKRFQFGGTKDRRAVTVQRVSCYRVDAVQLLAAGKGLRNAAIGDLDYQEEGLELGELAGNEFAITLRDCHFPGEDGWESAAKRDLAEVTVGRAVKNLNAKGYLNYFGLQRFGSYSVTTDSIGTKLLQGNLRGAIDDILQFNPDCLAAGGCSGTVTKMSQDDIARAKSIYIWNTTQDSDRALEGMPRKFAAETNIIRFLGKTDHGRLVHPTDFQGALMMLPRNLRLMYIHAYQSLVWNAAASKRWELIGERVVAGDLVVVNDHTDKPNQHTTNVSVDESGETIICPTEHDRIVNFEDTHIRARALSTDEAESGAYTVFDVVLPLPGYDVTYPPNEIGKFYEAFMASERGGGIDPYNMRRSWKDISLSGGYRKLIVRPASDVIFEVRTYTDGNEQFVQTDLTRLQYIKAEHVVKEKTLRIPAAPTELENDWLTQSSQPLEQSKSHDQSCRSQSATDEPQMAPICPPFSTIKLGLSAAMSEAESPSELSTLSQAKIAVILRMQLGPSQYATMALRELMGRSGFETYTPAYGNGR